MCMNFGKQLYFNMYNKYFNMTTYYKIYVFIVTYMSYRDCMHLICMLHTFVIRLHM